MTIETLKKYIVYALYDKYSFAPVEEAVVVLNEAEVLSMFESVKEDKHVEFDLICNQKPTMAGVVYFTKYHAICDNPKFCAENDIFIPFDWKVGVAGCGNTF